MISLRPLLTSFGLLVASPLCLAAANNQCYWDRNPGPMTFTIDMGTLWVPRDAPIGSPIGKVDTFKNTPNGRGQVLGCDNDGSVRLTAQVMANVPPHWASLPPLAGGLQDDGTVLQTSVAGVGVKIRLEHPFDGKASNAFIPVGSPVVPFEGYLEHHTGAANLVMSNLVSRITLIKTGEIEPGPQSFDSRTMLTATVSDVGLAFTAHLAGTILQAQCTVSSRLVSADPVPLGEDWNTSDFTGPGFTTPAVPFQINLESCADNPAGSVARAHIRLEGTRGSQPIEPLRGLFSLTDDSDAEGMAIQVLMGDGNTPVALGDDVPILTLPTSGPAVLPFTARYYQTGTNDEIRPGTAKGALNFTITYQ